MCVKIRYGEIVGPMPFLSVNDIVLANEVQFQQTTVYNNRMLTVLVPTSIGLSELVNNDLVLKRSLMLWSRAAGQGQLL